MWGQALGMGWGQNPGSRGKGTKGGTGLGGAAVPDVRCHMWDVILRSGIEVGFISDNWGTDALILDSRRKWLNYLRT